MKKNSILILIAICLFGCGKSSQETNITGEIEELGTDTLYLYGMDELYDHIDTIFTQNGKFSISIPIDTITPAFLLIKKQIEYPVFLDKGNKIKIKGNVASLEALSVNGNIYNEEFTAFQNELNRQQTVHSERDAERKAEEFIRNHPSSFVSLYLLDKFFVRKEAPDFDKIKEFTKSMTGVLQDKSYIEHLNEYIAQAEKIETDKYAPFFSLTNAKGERITRSSDAFKKKNLLINFWASWSDSTARRRCNTELKTLYKKYKGNTYFNMLGVSLDIDKKEWQNAIERDTLSWEQVCDFGGLDSEIAKQYAVSQLPGNILLSADGKILAKNLWGEALKKKIDEAISIAEEKAKKENRKNR